jgi:hypothetical protein
MVTRNHSDEKPDDDVDVYTAREEFTARGQVEPEVAVRPPVRPVTERGEQGERQPER